jgi:hypothetical protein
MLYTIYVIFKISPTAGVIVSTTLCIPLNPRNSIFIKFISFLIAYRTTYATLIVFTLYAAYLRSSK